MHYYCFSVSQPFKGDYLEIHKNPKYQKLNSAVEEKVLLADVVNKINRANGKASTFLKITLLQQNQIDKYITSAKSDRQIQYGGQ